MPVRVFQVDVATRFEPFTFERETIEAIGGTFDAAHCTTEEEVIANAGDAEILLLARMPIVTPAVMDALPNVRLIIRWGVGYDQIDVAAATARGIAVANAPTYCTQDVAEHAMSMLHVIARRVVWAHERMRTGAYTPPTGPIHRLTGALGIIGCGRIGSEVAKRAQGIGMNVVAYDKYKSDSDLLAKGITQVSYDELLRVSDYITIHVLLTSETRKMVDAESIARMKPDVMIVNTSRGPVIDQEDALVDALANGRLAGVALDVFEREPLAIDHPLRSMEHVVLTPHAAAFTLESLEELRHEMCNTITNWIRDGWSEVVVNPVCRN